MKADKLMLKLACSASTSQTVSSRAGLPDTGTAGSHLHFEPPEATGPRSVWSDLHLTRRQKAIGMAGSSEPCPNLSFLNVKQVLREAYDCLQNVTSVII